MNRSIHIKAVPIDIIEKFKAIAEQQDRSMSYVMRKALEAYVTQDKPQKVLSASSKPTPDGQVQNSQTPAQIARGFFATPQMHDLASEKYSLPLEEVQKFILYWTEPTKSGKRQRWETETTFDVKRRLITWRSYYEKRKPKQVTNNF